MNFSRTPTPAYRNQQPNGTRPQPAGLLGWLSSLLRTPTPAYKTPPPPEPIEEPGEAHTDKPGK